MRIQHNIPAMSAYRNYNNNTSALSKNLEKLSSGYKINRAGDDAAGLAISEKMRAQITGLSAAQKNVKDGISLVKTAEGAMQEIHDMLNRMDYLATQSANGTYDNEVDRNNLQKEVESLKAEINRIADSANFNGIKLLDGSQSKDLLAVDGTMKSGTAQMAKGIDIEVGKGGGGSKGEYTIDIQNPFGAGDTLTLGGSSINATTGAKTDLAGFAAAGQTITYGTDFDGATAEEQAKSLANFLNGQAGLTQYFDITAEGSSVKLTNKEEGDKWAEITKFEVPANSDKVTTAATTWKATDGTAAAAGTAVSFSNIFGANTANSAGTNLKVGDKLEFEFELANGKKLTATLEVDENIANASTNEMVAQKVAEKLKNTAFNEDGATAAKESKMKVGDLFEVTGKTGEGTLQFNAKSGGVGGATKVNITSGLVTKPAEITIADSGSAYAYDTKLDATAGASDFTAGDTMTIKGQLSDGRKFEFDVVAGKDFDIDKANTQTTMENLRDKLTSDAFEITLDDGSKVKGSDIFVDAANASGSGKEIALTASANGGMKFESTIKGDPTTSKGIGYVSEVKLQDPKNTKANFVLTNGAQKTGAMSTVTFSDDAVEYGSVVEVNGKSYEIVKKASERTNYNNIAVEVDDPSDAAKVASAFAKAVSDTDTDLTASAKGNRVEISTQEVGSHTISPTLDTNGETVKTIEFKLDPNKIQAGSKVTINGQTYEFTGLKGKAGEGNIAISTNLRNANSKSLGDALLSAVKANAKNTANVSMDEDGLVTVKGTVSIEGEVTNPSVRFTDGKGGLKLQIGDTSDDFNQLKVSVGDMHTVSMGDGTLTIADIDISNQDNAAAAIDVIKGAINYVSSVRGDLGAIQNRLDHTANNLSVMAENIQDAESTIRDTDVADEMMSYVKNNILVQSAQAMLAQANQLPQGVLQLLG